MENNTIDPNRSVSTPQNLTIDEQDALTLNALPVEVLEVILEKLEDASKESLVSNLWYKTVVKVVQKKDFDQIKEALYIIIPEVEKINDEKAGLVAEKLKNLLSGEALFTNLANRTDFENTQKKIRRDIILILKELDINEDDFFKTYNNLVKSQGIKNINHIPENDYPLFAKLLLSAHHEKHIVNRDPRYDFTTYGKYLFPYAKFTKDEDMLISFGELFGNSKKQYFNFILEGLLQGGNVDNIKTAMRMMSKLKTEGYKFEWFLDSTFHSVHTATECLLRNNKINLILKVAEIFGESKIKETYELFIPKLLEGKKSAVLQQAMQQLKESNDDYNKDEILLSLLHDCISSLFVEGKLEEGFKLLDELAINNKFDLNNYFRSRTGLITRFDDISRENQLKILDEAIKRIIRIDNVVEGNQVVKDLRFEDEDFQAKYKKNGGFLGLLRSCLTSYFRNGNIEDSFTILDKIISLNKKILHPGFIVGEYFQFYLGESIHTFSEENLIEIVRRINVHPDLVNNKNVKEFLRKVRVHQNLQERLSQKWRKVE